jgi:SAM-dependent methyltransferase
MSSSASNISSREGYALWADTWDSTPSPIVALEHRHLLPWIESLTHRLCVDVGCGTGRWTAQLGGLGFDASPEMLAVAANKPGLRGRLAAADAVALPIAGGTARLVLCCLTLAHIRERDAAMGELVRIIAPGGTLIITDFHAAGAARGWKRTFRHDGQLYELENHPYTLDDLRRTAEGLGLRLEDFVDATIGESEREIFHRAGRPELFNAATETPSVLLTRWTRP